MNDKRPIPRNIFIKARGELKKLLDVNYDPKEKNHKFGPPEFSLNMLKTLPKEYKEIFPQEAIKAGLLAKHPLGGYMDARYKDPSQEKDEYRETMLGTIENEIKKDFGMNQNNS